MTDLAFASTGRCCLLSSSTSHTTARDMKATGLLMFALAGPDQGKSGEGCIGLLRTEATTSHRPGGLDYKELKTRRFENGRASNA